MKNLHDLLSVSASSFKLKTNDKRVLNTLSEMLTANREKSVLGKLALFTGPSSSLTSYRKALPTVYKSRV